MLVVSLHVVLASFLQYPAFPVKFGVGGSGEKDGKGEGEGVVPRYFSRLEGSGRNDRAALGTT